MTEEDAMSEPDEYVQVAAAYSDAVRALFTLPSVPTGTGERGFGRAFETELTDAADRLSPLSDNLTRVTTIQLNDDDPDTRVLASTRLLAKALTDLQVSTVLFEAAVDEELGRLQRGGETSRLDTRISVIEEQLKILLEEVEPQAPSFNRGLWRPQTLTEARGALEHAAADALHRIPDRAVNASQAALLALAGIGAGLVAEAAGAIGMSAAQLLGQSEKASRLYQRFRDFVAKAYDALVAVLGQQTARAAMEKARTWIQDIKDGRTVTTLLEGLYQTRQTAAEVTRVVTERGTDLERLITCVAAIQRLDANYRRQIHLAEKLLHGARLLGGVSTAVIPHGQLLFVALYMIVVGYVVLAGADFVDAPELHVLDRVPGVRRVVEQSLNPA
jgi:hypothetical protein